MEILTIVEMISKALGVIGSFKGSPAVAKVTAQIQDAANVVGALSPLVQQFANGQEVTLEDAREALTGMHTALADFDAAITAKGG